MNMYEHIPINRHGYFVTHQLRDGHGMRAGMRTYACANKIALAALLLHLTGRTIDTFVEDERGLPKVPGVVIAFPCHIYGAEESSR